MDEEMGFDEFGWYDDDGGPDFRPPRVGGAYRNRYNDAYGDYRGGYGPPGVRGPPGPPLGFGFSPKPIFMLGRGFGPGGPPPVNRFRHEDKAIKYLMRCGVAKETLKNLPKEFLQYIEPHYCGICGQNFESFSMSRMHYISKNHTKNQKRWLSQKPEIGSISMRKEIPLRARELYCELCDIQITSKAHADSHYSGKPHRAIVEGRKNPKNPMLLQHGMQSRLEQLIRREKKHLKSVAPEPAAVEDAKEPKSFKPELYCDICKTSVTCTEQMTMHLNGKRHLTKEKQHILKMMKGDIAENKDGNSGEATKANEDEPKGDGDAENSDEEDKEKEDFDWGNDGGDWDEPTTTTEGLHADDTY
ncbi:unnamed protein product [Diatraea saccharalis]|uniref:C2H2-type domain-containing protein n=1 Tax=Diatraea saccharalis TaxID=40085 RepID=A0A9P0C2Z8_9NEOP|nr:unnamed protein product [Diatraea saccharalis]